MKKSEKTNQLNIFLDHLLDRLNTLLLEPKKSFAFSRKEITGWVLMINKSSVSVSEITTGEDLEVLGEPSDISSKLISYSNDYRDPSTEQNIDKDWSLEKTRKLMKTIFHQIPFIERAKLLEEFYKEAMGSAKRNVAEIRVIDKKISTPSNKRDKRKWEKLKRETIVKERFGYRWNENEILEIIKTKGYYQEPITNDKIGAWALASRIMYGCGGLINKKGMLSYTPTYDSDIDKKTHKALTIKLQRMLNQHKHYHKN